MRSAVISASLRTGLTIGVLSGSPHFSKVLEENGSTLAIRTECQGVCGKVFKAVGVAVPPTARVVTS
jgi:hypothetical protein